MGVRVSVKGALLLWRDLPLHRKIKGWRTTEDCNFALNNPSVYLRFSYSVSHTTQAHERHTRSGLAPKTMEPHRLNTNFAPDA